MAAPQNFRTAFNGFNRDDVVNYISFITTKHENQVNQLRSEMDELRQELAERPQLAEQDEAELIALREQVTRLQAQLRLREETAPQLQQVAAPVGSSLNEQELNAYRRAESAERRAMERVSQMYAKANGILADTVARLEEHTGRVNQMADRVSSDLEALEKAVAESKTVLADSATVIASIHPED